MMIVETPPRNIKLISRPSSISQRFVGLTSVLYNRSALVSAFAEGLQCLVFRSWPLEHDSICEVGATFMQSVIRGGASS